MRWVLALVALCAAAAVMFDRTEPPSAVSRDQLELWRLHEEVLDASDARLQWAAYDSVRRLLPDRPGVRFELRAPLGEHVDTSVLAPQLGDSADRAVRALVDAELRELGEPRARLAVAVLPVLEDVPYGDRTAAPVKYFADADSLGAWCAVVLTAYVATEAELTSQLERGGSPLGPCRLWARFGTPGAAVRSVLPEAGHLMAMPSPSEPDPPARRRTLAGIRDYDVDAVLLGPHAQACLAGRTENCLPSLFVEQEWRRFWGTGEVDAPALATRSRYGRHRAEPVDHFFADVEHAIGAERFAELWRADGEFESALGEALRTDADEWVHAWAVARYGAEPRGPGVDPATGALTLLGAGLFGLASVGVARRRRVG